MGELDERRWAVISERGKEADGLVYDEARELLRRLIRENVHGTAIVTNEAASRIRHPTSRSSPGQSQPARR